MKTSSHCRYKGDSDKDFVFVHLMSRVIKPTYFGCQYPLSDDDKYYMVSLLKRLDHFFCFDLLCYCIMDNHFHAVIRVKKDAEKKLARTEVTRRYEEFYLNKRHLDARSAACFSWRDKLNDFSSFMWLFLRMTSYRHNRRSDRRGSLWQDGFKSVVIESASALATTLKYVELNPLRAKLVKHPADYRWSSWGETHGDQAHPYRQRIIDSLRWAYALDESVFDNEIFARFGAELTRLATFEFNDDTEYITKMSEGTYQFLLNKNASLTHGDRLSEGSDQSFKT
ncbi:MAG: hypothetical protein HRT88_01505 [Lentisphaeraceae bacterium]|nr:hypothetical protein [Lentisphaeraceae bacterium]